MTPQEQAVELERQQFNVRESWIEMAREAIKWMDENASKGNAAEYFESREVHRLALDNLTWTLVEPTEED